MFDFFPRQMVLHMSHVRYYLINLPIAILACFVAVSDAADSITGPHIVVLGIGQDAGFAVAYEGQIIGL